MLKQDYNLNELYNKSEPLRRIDENLRRENDLALAESERLFRQNQRERFEKREQRKVAPSPIKQDLHIPESNYESQGFSKNAKAINPIRTRQPQPVRSFLFGEHLDIHRHVQGGNALIIESAGIKPCNKRANGAGINYAGKPSHKEFENVARNAEIAWHEIKPTAKGFNECRDAIKRHTRAEYDDYLRSINLCPNCRLPIALKQATEYKITDVIDNDAKLIRRRKGQRLSRKILHKQKYFGNTNTSKTELSSHYDRVTFGYADIPLHFEVFNSASGLVYRMILGSDRIAELTRVPIKIEQPCKGNSRKCRNDACKCQRKVKTFYLEYFTENGEVLTEFPKSYRVIDTKCSCVKRILPCGFEVSNNVILNEKYMAKHHKVCKDSRCKDDA